MKRQIIVGPDTKIAHAGGRPPKVVLALLIEQIGLFILWAFADAPAWFSQHLAASAAQCLGKLEFWQPLTALWVHVGSRSLLLNMLALWIFGSALERWWGPRRFLLFWMVTGVVGLVAGVLVGQLQPTYVMAGSAGSAVAMMVAFGLIFPEHLVFFYGVLPLKAKHMVWALIGFVLLGSVLGGTYLEVAVQLGGGAAVWLFMRRRNKGPGDKGSGKRAAGKRGGPGLKVIQGGRRKDEPHYWN